MTTPTPPPGWHPDPEGRPQLRWWDGRQWTSATKPNAIQEGPKSPPPPIDPKARKRNNLIAVGVIATTAAILIGFGIFGSNEKDSTVSTSREPTTDVASSAAAPTSSTYTPPADNVMRDFWLRVDREGYLTINVNGTYTDAQLESAFLEVRRMYTTTKKGGGWHVFIDCGEGMQATGGARQANGKFALDSLGAARTGLSVGQYEFEPLDDRRACPLDVPQTAPDALTAQAVVDAVRKAGLPASDPRVNTVSCVDMGCVQLVTTDEFSVYQFADPQKAAKLASLFPLGYRNGVIFLRFNKDGSDPTDPVLIPQYQAILDQLLK
ncbi:DUF2510 domain-containing protein [Rhodococcus sp. NPDC056960]|uniref:DUF2510 domain-containing protein n=1 Tax=Rhodococcus sp. NPDC056960 TaxID=3345982 RepID=UPI0036264F33